ncbi:retrovirus-related pol polyprotein from transposon TNT 1-94 [Tanacetum coccineum]
MFAAIETRFGWLKQLPRKTQKTLLKQQYEYFCAQSAEVLDSIFIRLKKIVIVWKNKPEIKTMSIDDLYNNFKIVEQKIKKTVGTSSGGQNLAFTTAPNSSSTNDANTAYSQVSAALVVHLFKLGHFARECRASRSKEDQFRNQDNTRKQGNKEDTSKAMLAIDGVDSEVYIDKTCSKTCLNNYETLKKQYDDLLAKLLQTKFEGSTYKRGLDTVEAQLVTYRKNEVLFSEEVAVLKREVGIKQYEINMLKTEFKKVKQEKDGIEFKIEKFDKASKDIDQLLESQITDKSKKGLGYSAVPLPHPLIYNRPNKLDLSYSGLDEFKEPEFKAWVQCYPSHGRLEAHDWVHIAHLSDLQRSLMRGYVAFGGGAFGVKFLVNDTECLVLSPNFKLPDENQILLKVSRKNNMYSFDMKNIVPKEILTLDKKVKIIRSDNGTEFKNKVKDDFCREKGIKREYSVARTPQQNGVAERRNRTLIEAARRISKAFRVYNTRTKRVEENLHIGFLENKPMIEGTGPKWLFDINSLIQSMNYVPVSAGTISNVSEGISEGNSQECIVMPIWKDTSYFDSPTENVDNGEPKTANDAQKQNEDGLNNENNKQEWFANDSSSKDVNSIGQQVNTASLDNNNVQSTVQTRRMLKPTSEQGFLSDEELLQFKLQQVWILVDLPNGKKAIGTKWVFRNKKDERGIVIRNKARLVIQGHRQEEGIDYEEVFAPVVRIEAIRLFLAYASFMGFLVYQMDVKSTFLYGTIEKEVYVTQPPGFKDPDHPDKVYKVVKQKGDILLVRVYVDDIIFGSTNKELCTGFEKLMKDKFQMNSMGELTFFLRLQVQQKEDGIFISQDKYVAEILKKFNYSDVKSASTPVDLEKPLVKDGDADDVDYSRDSPFELVAYTDSDYAGATLDRKSTNWREDVVLGNRLIYWLVLKSKTKTVVATSTTEAEYVAAASCCGQVNKWYGAASNASSLDAEGQLVSSNKTQSYDYTYLNQLLRELIQVVVPGVKIPYWGIEMLKLGCDSYISSFNPPLSRGYTLESEEDNMKLIGIDEISLKLVLSVLVFAIKRMLMLPVQVSAVEVNLVIYTSCIEQFWATAKVQTVNGVRQLQALVDKKRVIVMESSIRRDLHLDDAEAFFSPQWKYFIHTITQCLSAKSTAWNEFSSSMASLIICLATNQKFNLSKYIFDAMVKHLDGGVKFLLYPRFLQVFINQQLSNMSTHKKIFVNPLHTKKVFANMKRAGKDFSGRITPLFDTMMVQPIEEIGEDSDHPTNSTPIPIIDQQSSSSQPKKDKPSKKAQRQEAEVPQDKAEHEESVLNLQKAKDAQAKEIAALKKRIRRLQRRKISRPTGLKRLRKVGMSQRVKSFEDQESLGIPEDASKQGRNVADETQSKEREELTDEEKAKLFMELMEKKRKHFAALRAQEKRNRPPTKAQKKTQMSTYLKHIDGYIYKQLKGKSFDEIQKLFDKEMKRVNTFVAMGSKVQENKEKKEEGREETAKEKESEEVEEDDEVKLKKLLVIKKDEDIAIDAIPLATKLPVLIDYKLHKEGMLIHYEFIGADGSSKRYSSMIRMIQGIDREDLEALWRIVKAKYGDTMPEDEFERVLYGDLRVMFEPDIKSDVWRMLQGYRVTTWKLIDSSGVYFDVTAAQVHNRNYAKRKEHKSVIKEAESSANKDALEDKKSYWASNTWVLIFAKCCYQEKFMLLAQDHKVKEKGSYCCSHMESKEGTVCILCIEGVKR